MKSSQSTIDDSFSSISGYIQHRRRQNGGPSNLLDPYSELDNRQRSLLIHISERRMIVQSEGEEWDGLEVAEISRYLKRISNNNINVLQVEYVISFFFLVFFWIRANWSDTFVSFSYRELIDDLEERGYIVQTIDESHYDLYDWRVYLENQSNYTFPLPTPMSSPFIHNTFHVLPPFPFGIWTTIYFGIFPDAEEVLHYLIHTRCIFEHTKREKNIAN